MTMPIIEGLRIKNKTKDEIIIYVTIQLLEDNIRFVIYDISLRKYKTRKHSSINEMTKDSYVYQSLRTEMERKTLLADYYLKYVTETQVEQALLNAWEICKPKINE